MADIDSYIEDLKKKSEERFEQFKIVDISSIKEISNDAYLEKPTWLGGDKKFVCLFIDLDKSSKISFKKHPKTMAKIYDYFTQNIVDILNHPTFGADYIDIKGDGAFGIFEGDKASYKALYCAITFKTLFEQSIRDKFSDEEDQLSCKFGIHKDKLLVRKIGKRGHGNYNEVWAGRLVNNAAKLANQAKDIPQDIAYPLSLPILISEQVHSDFEKNKEFGFYHCCTGNGQPLPNQIEMFKEVNDFSDETLGDKFYYTRVIWCKNCADNYINLI
ncbi:hypothetical protein K8Q94_03335 [Candidatus Nomurabacteria bacterium]|nr:hypothetical protein [Candidatus Nomurabacteria bacterium]